jgi:GNAT superfamily N-acetyltransferase
VTTATTFTLRQMTPTDGTAIAELGEQTPDTGAVAFKSQFHVDPYACLLALRPGTIGVVAENPGFDGLVGIGLMSFGEFHFEGAIRPYAYLYSLSVHPNHRRQGLASQIGAWRVARARERFGDEGVILAGIQAGNEGSLAVAKTWSGQRIDRTQVAIATVRARAPHHESDLEVRPATAADFEEIASRQNAYYASYNLYPPVTTRSLGEWRSQAPFGFEIHDRFVVADQHGNLVAGLAMTEEGRLMSTRLVRLPPPLRLANAFLKITPPDGVLRRLHVDSIWFRPGHEDAATFLWESVRWLARDRGTTLMTFLDPQAPVARLIPMSRLMPRQIGSLVIRAPQPLDQQRLIYQLV